MFPWIWWWAPHVEFPLSGNVTQDIEPSTQWFFGRIKPEAGDGRIEQKAFELVSYGRQLGLLTEVVIGLAEKAAPAEGEGAAALAELKRLREQIAHLKDAQHAADDEALAGQVQRVVARGGARARRVSRRLKPLLEA